jgi:hypothetical protein
MADGELDDLLASIENTVKQLQEKTVQSIREHAEKSVQARSMLKGLAHELVTQGDQLDESAKAIAAGVQGLRAAMEVASKPSPELLERAQRLEDLVANKDKALTDALERLEKLETATAQRETDHESRRSSLEQLQATLADRDVALQAAQQRAAKLERDAADRDAEKSNVNDRTKKLEDVLAEKARELEAAATREQQLEKKCAELADASQATAQRFSQIEREKADAEKVQRAAQERASNAEAALKDAAKSAEGISSELARQREANTKAQDELKVARDEISRLRLQADKAVEARKLYQVEKERADALDTRLKGETAEGTRTALAEQLAKALKELEKRDNDNIMLRRELDALRREQEGGETEAEPESEMSSSMIGRDRDGRRRHIGEILLDAGTITAPQLDAALETQRRAPQRHLGEILIGQGFASEDTVAQALACQCNMQFVRLNENQIDRGAATMISKRLAKLRHCIPLRTDGDAVVVAFFNPLDLIAIEDLERATSRRVDPVVATHSDITRAIDAVFAPAAPSA